MVGINDQYSVDSDVCFHRPSCRLLNPIGGGNCYAIEGNITIVT